jgi:hypothetical protein
MRSLEIQEFNDRNRRIVRPEKYGIIEGYGMPYILSESRAHGDQAENGDEGE